jgi:predicted amidohydrolase YtcJ
MTKSVWIVKTAINLFALCSLIAPLNAARSQTTPKADNPPPAVANLVLLHGKVRTQDSNRSVAQALAIRGNTIVAVGTDQFVSALIGPQTQMIDLAGQTVLPGIIDAHTHPAQSAQDLGKCNLHDQELTPAKIKAELAECLKNHPDHPIGGRIERSPSGTPTGTLRDAAADIAAAAAPAARILLCSIATSLQSIRSIYTRSGCSLPTSTAARYTGAPPRALTGGWLAKPKRHKKGLEPLRAEAISLPYF